MTHPELTERAPAAKTLSMQGTITGQRRSGLRGFAGAVAMGGLIALGGCVSVNAPDKPIVIELNINITQDVVYRLAPDVQKTIDKNEGIF